MLIQRIVTAIVALAAIAVALLTLPPLGITALVGVLFALGGREWGRLVAGSGAWTRYGYAASTGLGCLLLWWASARLPALPVAVYVAGLAGWVWSFVMILTYPRPLGRGLTLLTGLYVLLPAFLALALIFNGPDGVRLLLFMLLIVWCADAGAYFAGKAFGRRKLAPTVSPGKSWEGVFGGLAAAALAGGVGGAYLGLPAGAMVLIALGTAMISIVGDLTVSMFKRNAGVKDSGRLFPGHGGVLDRIDSICAAAPLFALCLGFVSSG